MADERSAETSERTGQDTPTVIDGMAAAARQAAEGTPEAVGRAASESRDATERA